MSRRRPGCPLAVRAVTAAALLVTAAVHWHLAGHDTRSGVNQEDLFHLQAALAVVGAVLLIGWPRLAVMAGVALLGAGTLAAVLVTRYYDVGAIGPVVDLYEPLWYPGKVASAVADGVAFLGGALALALAGLRPRLAVRQPAPPPSADQVRSATRNAAKAR